MTTYSESQLIQKTKGKRSLRKFADYLNENIPRGTPGVITWMMVFYWIKEIHPVTGESLMAWVQHYPSGDERHELAKDILAQRTRSGGASSQDKKRILRTLGRE